MHPVVRGDLPRRQGRPFLLARRVLSGETRGDVVAAGFCWRGEAGVAVAVLPWLVSGGAAGIVFF